MVFFITATEKSDPLFASGINGTSNTKSNSDQQSKSTAKKAGGSLRVESGQDPLFSDETTEAKRVSKTDAKRKSASNNKPLFDDDEQKYVLSGFCLFVCLFVNFSKLGRAYDIKTPKIPFLETTFLRFNTNVFFNISRPLFGDDDNVADTLGINFKANKKEDSAKKADTKKTASDSDDVSLTKDIADLLSKS